MAIRFLHTADWHIGRRFSERGERARPHLQRARLEVISAIAAAGRQRGIASALVAGDVFDSSTTSEPDLRATLSKLRSEASISWHLLPGNHDAAVPGGVWERMAKLSLPENVRVITTGEPFAISDSAAVVPAPLRTRHASHDPTRDFDTTPTPNGWIRIGLAHGSAQQFGGDSSATANLIAPDRAQRAGLDYLALGDWHGTMEVAHRTWYAGTPEFDRSLANDQGHVLAVSLAAPGAEPSIERIPVSQYRWERLALTLHEAGDLERLDQHIHRLGSAASRAVVDLSLMGALDARSRADVEAKLEQLSAEVLDLSVDLAGLTVAADLDDLDTAPRLRALLDALRREEEAATDPIAREIAAHARLRALQYAPRRDSEGPEIRSSRARKGARS